MDEGAARGPEDLFEGFPASLAVCHEVERAVSGLGGVSTRTTRSQVAFRRRRGFAYAWRPGQYVANPVPLVLSVALPREVTSPRIKEVAHPSAGVWMHHLELSRPEEVDDEVRAWLVEAHGNAG